MVGWVGWAPTGIVALAALLASPVNGQTHAFNWKFGNNFVLTEVSECQTLPITIVPIDGAPSTALGVPPYYLIAFELGGVPTTSMVGNDPSSLSWQVVHKRGTSLMLTMVDSNTTGGFSGTGGVSNTFYNVTSGSSTSCLPTATNTSTLTSVHPNVTDTLTTCQPWGLTMGGGQKPYTVVLSALGSPIITNVTLGSDDDVFTFPNRADPNGQIMASVVDASGKWGVSSQPVRTVGSSDTACIGWRASSATSAEIAQQAIDRQRAEEAATKRKHTTLVVGVSVGLGVPMLLALAIGVWYFVKRKPEHERGVWDDQDVAPRAYDTGFSGGDMSEVDAAGMRRVMTVSSKRTGLTYGSPTATPLMEVTPIPPVYFDREIRQAGQGGGPRESTASSSDTSPSGSQPSAYLTQRQLKALEAHGITHGQSGAANSQSSTRVSSSAGPSGNTFVGTPSLDPDVQPDIIIQHRDGGGGTRVVQELPPPYANHS